MEEEVNKLKDELKDLKNEKPEDKEAKSPESNKPLLLPIKPTHFR